MANGIPASRGLGIGSICVIEEHELKYEAIKFEDTEKEQKRFQESIEQFKKETEEMAEDIRQKENRPEGSGNSGKSPCYD